MQKQFATFVLERLQDESGVSGTGIIAQGVQFSSGQVVLSWVTQFKSTGIYADIEEMMAIHGHGGKTRIVWRNEEDESLATERARILHDLDRAMESNGGLLVFEKMVRIIKAQ